VISKNRFSCSLFLNSLSAVVAVFVTATCVSAQVRAAIPPTENIVGLMTQAQADNLAGLRPYTVTRAYRLFEGTYTDEVRALVIAEITVEPPESKKYNAQRRGGLRTGRETGPQNVGQ
jgi:hypothetical protein